MACIDVFSTFHFSKGIISQFVALFREYCLSHAAVILCRRASLPFCRFGFNFSVIVAELVGAELPYFHCGRARGSCPVEVVLLCEEVIHSMITDINRIPLQW